MQCRAVDCEKKVLARGWCSKHYTRWYRGIHPRSVSGYDYVWEKFIRKVDASGDCWLWTGARIAGGYGRFNTKGHNYAHRYMWTRLVGPIPERFTLDHLCRVRHCVNPDHLEPVSMIENLRRGVAPPALNALKTYCKSGHEFTSENTIWYADGRKRRCRICGRRWTADYQQRQRGGIPPRPYKTKTRDG